MAFFDSVPQSPPPRPRPSPPRPWARPEGLIPGSVAADFLLARTDEVAVAIGSLRAYPSGFEFSVHVRLRHEDDATLGAADPVGMRRRPGTPEPDQVLRLGVLYADGRRAAAGASYYPPDAPGSGELVLQPSGSHGSDRRWDADFWLHPLPPDGPVTFVASWLARGVPETRAEVDAAAIRAAAARAVTLWPDDLDAAGRPG